MPALTYSQIVPILGSYVEPGGDFLASLNQVLARIYNMGVYKDLTVQYSLPVVDQGIVLPPDADSVLHLLVDNQPAPVRSLWHDFKSVGAGSWTGLSWGLIDSGYWPVYSLLPEAGVSYLYIFPVTPTSIDASIGESIRVTAVTLASENDVNPEEIVGTLDDAQNRISFASAVRQIKSITFEGLTQRYTLYTAQSGGYAVATIGPGSGVAQFRRFRLNGSTDGSTTVHVLCKRAFVPIDGANDIIYLSNIGAIKHGLLGRIAEDSADLERSEYHWQRCMLLLEEEANSVRGAAVPRLNIDPMGTGIMNRLYQQY